MAKRIQRTEEEKRTLLSQIEAAVAAGTKLNQAAKETGIQLSQYYAWKKQLQSKLPVTSPSYRWEMRKKTQTRVVKKPKVLATVEKTPQMYVLIGDATQVAQALKELL